MKASEPFVIYFLRAQLFLIVHASRERTTTVINKLNNNNNNNDYRALSSGNGFEIE
jgi:hypothetical protein